MARRGVRDVTVVANDAAMPGKGIGKLVTARCASKVIASHVGLNAGTQRKMISGEIEVGLAPQGTWDIVKATGVELIVESDAPEMQLNEVSARTVPSGRVFAVTSSPTCLRDAA